MLRTSIHTVRLSTLTSVNLPFLGLAVIGGLLGLVTIVQCLLSVAVILVPREALYGEAMVYDHAARLLRGEPLYQPLDRPRYTVAAYTPVYYLLGAGLQALIGPGFAPGRSLSFVAGLTSAILVAHLVTRRLRDQWAGSFAALLFLALGLPWLYLWSALYRVDLVGVALSLGAVAALLGGTTPRRIVLGGLLAGLAILTKQTFIAAGLAGTVWLWQHDSKKAGVFASACLLTAVGVCVAMEISTGAFLANTVFANANPFQVDPLMLNLSIFALFQGGPLAIAGLYLLNGRRSFQHEDKLLAYYFVASLLPLVGLGKVGSDQNYWIECAAITAVLATLGIWTRLQMDAESGRVGGAFRPLGLLGVTVGFVTLSLSSSALPAWSEVAPNPAYEAEFKKLVERVQAEPREVLAEPLDVVVLAGRRTLFEPTIFGILHGQGLWDASPLYRDICAGQIGLLVLSQPLGDELQQRRGYAHWPAAIIGTLQDTMVFDAMQAGRSVYVPGPRATISNCDAAAF
jgi:hypothetical protein